MKLTHTNTKSDASRIKRVRDSNRLDEHMWKPSYPWLENHEDCEKRSRVMLVSAS